MKNKLLTSLCLVLAGLAMIGCEADLAKTVEQTDVAVYEIIDSTWNEDYGTKDNYSIDSTDPNQARDAINKVIFDRLTLSAAVAMATAQNRTYKKEKENLFLTALEETDVQHLYEPIPFAKGTGGYRMENLRKSDNETGTFTVDIDDDVSLDGDYTMDQDIGNNEGTGLFTSYGFNQLLATGAMIGTDLTLGWVDILSGDYKSGFSTIGTAVITQPLLRGAGRKIALENLTQAQQNTLYQIRSFNRFRKEFITEVITEYYRILQLNDERTNAWDYYFALAEMHKKLQKRTVAGKLPRHELEQADQDRMDAISSYMRAQRDYDNALDAFKMRLSIIPSTPIQLDMTELEALRESVVADINLSSQQAVEIALNQRLDLANAADIVMDAERKVDVAADAIRTELNFVGYANPQTHRKTIFGADPGEFDRTRDRYELSLQFDLPIDRRFEKNNYRRTLITLMQQQRAHQQMTDTVVLEVQTSHRRMTEARQRYQIKKKSVELAEKRTSNTLLLMQYNRANTRDALDAREDYLNAKNDETEALVDYAIAGLEFFRDTEIMKIRPDGMWEKKLPKEIQTVSLRIDSSTAGR